MFIALNLYNNTNSINFGKKQTVENTLKKSVRLSLNKIDYDSVDIKKVKKLVKAGSSLNQIGEAIGEKISTVRSILKHFGLSTKQGAIISKIDKEDLLEMINNGFSQKEIAKHYGISDVAALTPLLKQLGVRATADKVEQITKFELESLLEAKMTLHDIAEHYKVSPQYITARFKELGLKFPKIEASERTVTKEELELCVKQGMTKAEISVRYGITNARLTKIMQEYNIKTKFELEKENRRIVTVEELKEQLKTSWSKVEIARNLGTNDMNIAKLLKLYGLQMDPKTLPSKEELVKYIEKIKNLKNIKRECLPPVEENRGYSESYIRNCICNRFKIDQITLSQLLAEHNLRKFLTDVAKKMAFSVKSEVMKTNKV